MSTSPFAEPPPDPPRHLREAFLLDPGVVFLNHGSFGACPRPVFERYQRWQLELEREPVRFFVERFAPLMATARARLAAYVGTLPDNLVFVTNATTGVNVVARSLRLAPGDEVLGTNHEYGACERAWQFACARAGATYRRAEVPVPVASARDVADAVWAAVTERTKVLFISHITSPTALVMPVEDLCARARRSGLLTVVDGAHGPGQTDLELDRLGCDFYAGNCHKWLCAPKGAAFLYATPGRQDLVEPLVVSWGATNRDPGPSPFIDELEYSGTRDYAACLAIPAVLEFLDDNDWSSVRRVCARMADHARQRLLSLPGAEPVHAPVAGLSAQMEAVAIPAADPLALTQRLYDDYRVEMPAQAWGDRTLLRISLQGYNNGSDIDAAMTALGEIAGRGWT